jgi:hypothetical protein
MRPSSKIWTKHLTAGAAAICAAVLGLMGMAAPANAQRPAAAVTVENLPQRVTLLGRFTEQCSRLDGMLGAEFGPFRGFQRLLPNATPGVGAPWDSNEFVVPGGRSLIVTDVGWTQTGGAPGETINVALVMLDPLSTTNLLAKDFMNATGVTNADLRGGGSLHDTAGAEVGQGMVICATHDGTGDLRFLKVRGFLEGTR